MGDLGPDDDNLYYDAPDDVLPEPDTGRRQGYSSDDPLPPETPPIEQNAIGEQSGQPLSHPDPDILYAPPLPAEILQESAMHWFWRIIPLLTAWLHLHYHLLHRTCILLLKVLQVLFLGLGHLKPDDEAPVTLTTTFRRLNLNDEFEICPTCPTCHRIYPSDSPSSLKCSDCDIPLFKSWAGSTDSSSQKTAAPILQCPRRLISEQLAWVLNCAGIEEACEDWRAQIPKPGVKMSIMDGKIWRTICGHDGKPFFNNNPDRDDCNELQIGVTLGFDGLDMS